MSSLTARKLARLLDASADISDEKSTEALHAVAKYLNPLVVAHSEEMAEPPTKRQMKWNGLTIHVEYDKGQMRHGRKLPAAYGYIAGTHALDLDGIDVFIGPRPNDDKCYVYVVRQVGGKNFDTYDEDKVMIGYPSWTDAKNAFIEAQEEKRFGGMASFDVDEFVREVRKTGSIPQPVGGFDRWNPAMQKRPEARLQESVGKQVLALFGMDPTQPTNEQLDTGVLLVDAQDPIKEN